MRRPRLNEPKAVAAPTASIFADLGTVQALPETDRAILRRFLEHNAEHTVILKDTAQVRSILKLPP